MYSVVALLAQGAGFHAAYGAPMAQAEHYFQIEVAEGFVPTESAQVSEKQATRVLWRFAGAKERAVIVKAQYPNRRAWRGQEAFFAEIEAGVLAQSPGLKWRQKKQGQFGRLPYLDLSFRRVHQRKKEIVYMRFLFFRSFALSFTLASSEPALARRLDRFRKSFKPYFGGGG